MHTLRCACVKYKIKTNGELIESSGMFQYEMSNEMKCQALCVACENLCVVMADYCQIYMSDFRVAI